MPRNRNRARKGKSMSRRTVDPLSVSPDPLAGSLRPNTLGQTYRVVLSFNGRASTPGTPFLTTSPALDSFASFYVQGSIFDDFAAYSAVFDEYRITLVEFQITPRTPAGLVLDPGMITSVVDYDDATVPTSLTSLTDYASACTTRGDKTQIRTFKPKTTSLVYQSGVSSGYAVQSDLWLDCASPNVQYYGLKAGCTVTSGGPLIFDVYLRAQFEFRNSH